MTARAPLTRWRKATMAAVVVATAVAIGVVARPHHPGHRSTASYRSASAPASIPPAATTTTGRFVPTTTAPPPPPVPAALTATPLDLHAAAVAVPLDLQLPSISKVATVLGVGITPAGAMAAPEGRADDPDWQQAFWYRGSAIPGADSTAVIAGHVSDPLGRDGVFAHIDALRAGDPIVVRDTRTGLLVHFRVDAVATYPLAESSDPAVLARIYGAGPVAGHGPQPSADGLAHLTLITCAGTFVHGTHDHRFVAYATRVP